MWEVSLSILLFLAASTIQEDPPQGKAVLAVLDFEDKTSRVDQAVLEGTVDYVRTALAASSKFLVVDKTRMADKRQATMNALKEESHSPQYEDKYRIELGKALFADQLLMCQVVLLGEGCCLNCSLVSLSDQAARGGTVEEFPCDANGLADAAKRTVAALTGGSPSESRRLSLESAPAAPEVRSSGAVVTGAERTNAVADLTVVIRSPSGARLELKGPRGKRFASGSPYKNRAAQPGPWCVKAVAEGYAPVELVFTLPPDEVVLKEISLEQLGALEVSGVPEGADVAVKGPGGVAAQGGLPLAVGNLVPGTYRVTVSRTGYRTAETAAVVGPGRTSQVAVELKKGDEASSDMVFLPGGKFLLGNDYGPENESPVHEVTLDGFYLDEHEVTNEQYVRCVRSGDCSRAQHIGVKGLNSPQQPVVGVTWAQAAAYCMWSNGRLPTEAEWERAARGSEARLYPWGEAAPSCTRAHFGKCAQGERQGPLSAGDREKGCTTDGVCDLGGNAWEWVHDWYHPRVYSLCIPGCTAPEGPPGGKEKVLRGGSWMDAPDTLKSSLRYHSDPSQGYVNAGFRCARDAQ